MAGLLDFLFADPSGSNVGLLSKLFNPSASTSTPIKPATPSPFAQPQGLLGNSLFANGIRGGLAGLNASNGYSGFGGQLGAGFTGAARMNQERQQLGMNNALHAAHMDYYQSAADQRQAEATQAADKQARIEAMIAKLPPEQQDAARANPDAFYQEYSKSLFSGGEPPKMRTITKGASEVQQQWNSQNRAWEDVGEGPRFAPQNNTTIQMPRTIEERDQQTLLNGDPSTPEYHMAYRRQTQPRYQPSADGTRLIPIPQTLPPSIRQPIYAGGGAEGAGATGPTTPQPLDLGQRAPTAEQALAGGFASRMAASNGTIDRFSSAGTDLGQSARSAVPIIGNYLTSPERQQLEQAERDFVNAQLRRESGAAISAGEFDNARKQYFPQPGDSAAVIEQKRKNRELVIKGMNQNAGPSYSPPAPQAPAGGGATPDPLGIR